MGARAAWLTPDPRDFYFRAFLHGGDPEASLFRPAMPRLIRHLRNFTCSPSRQHAAGPYATGVFAPSAWLTSSSLSWLFEQTSRAAYIFAVHTPVRGRATPQPHFGSLRLQKSGLLLLIPLLTVRTSSC